MCKDPNYCNIKMPNKDNNILKHRPGDKSSKYPFIMYVDLEYNLQEIYKCRNNPNKSYTENKALHIPSGYTLFICCSFDKSKTEIIRYRGKDCIENLCKQLRDQATKIIIKKMEITLTNEEKRSYEIQECCHICNEKFCYDEDDEELKKNTK